MIELLKQYETAILAVLIVYLAVGAVIGGWIVFNDDEIDPGDGVFAWVTYMIVWLPLLPLIKETIKEIREGY